MKTSFYNKKHTMHLNQEEREFMVSILRTMIYNSIDDLKTELIDNKNLSKKNITY